MEEKEDKTSKFLSNLVVRRKSQNKTQDHKAIFCEGGKSLIISHGKSCHLYSTSTGNHVRELFRSQNKIISHHLHPLNELLVIAVTENGEVTVYNLYSNEIEHSTQLVINEEILIQKKISKFNFENEIEKEFEWSAELVNSLDHRKFIHAETKLYQGNTSKVYVWASWCLTDEIQAHVSVFNLESGKHKGSFSLRKSRLKKCKFNFSLSHNQELDFFVGLANHSIHVVYFDNKNSYVYVARKHYTGLNNILTCVAIHHTEYCIATGDSIGRITLWKNIFDKYPLKEIFHWHCMMVRDLIFSKYGNYIFSGGEENVLVKWSIITRKKQFLPRLSSAICHLSEASESSLLAVLTSDSRMLILDFNFHCVSTIQNFSKWCTLKERKDFNIFTIDPRSDCIVLNGKTGHIQFLSIKDEGKLMYTFDVTHRNFINSTTKNTLTNTEVTHAVFSNAGDWLITAENRNKSHSNESRLKFWKYMSDKGSYVLNTNVEFPHEGDEIYCLEISSDGTVATTGPDGKFRLWTVNEHTIGNAVKEIWSVHGVRKYRHHSCFAADFSKDSSLIAVTFSSILTVWDTNGPNLKCSLSSPNNKKHLKVCKFGNNEMSHLIVTGTECNVYCWNAITLSMVWSVPLNLSLLVSDPYSIYMAAFSSNRTLVVFNPASPSPDLLLKKVCRAPVVAARCGSNGSGRFCLFFLNSDQDVFCLGGPEKSDEASIVKEDKVIGVTPYVTQTPRIKGHVDALGEKLVSVMKNNQKSVSELLGSPAHTLSNPSFLCSQILKGLLMFSSGNKAYGRFQPTEGQQVKNLKLKANEENGEKDATTNERELLKIVKTIFV